MNGSKRFQGTCLIFLIFFSLCPDTKVLADDGLKVVKTVFVVGAKKTKEWVIFREMTIQKGDSIHLKDLPAKIKRSEENIYNLALFNEVKIHERVLEDELHFIISVKERWYILGAPQLSVEERNTYDLVEALKRRDFRRLVYGMAVQWRNVSGRNETFTFDGQLGFSKRLNIDFFRPALFRKANIDFRLGVHYVSEREVILGTDSAAPQWRRVELEPLQRSFEGYIGGRKRFSIYQSLYAELSYKNVQLSDSLYAFEPGGKIAPYITQSDGREYYPSLRLLFSDDHRDIKSFPLEGYKYQLFLRLAGGISRLSSLSMTKMGATWAHHIPLGKRWNFSYGFHNALILGDSIPFFEKNFVGINRTDFIGSSTELRGYERYALSGTFVNMNKAEVKFAIIPRQIVHLPYIPSAKFQDTPVGLYLTAFIDTGYILDESFNNQDQFLRNTFLTGYGMGINILGFYDLLFRLEYSRNHLNQGGIYFHATVPIK
jgi:outer membrane protein assembly factor BamA